MERNNETVSANEERVILQNFLVEDSQKVGIELNNQLETQTETSFVIRENIFERISIHDTFLKM